MHLLTLATGVLLLCGASIATSIRPFEALAHVPQGWKEIGEPASSRRIHLRIALQQPNHALFEQTLFSVSTPGDPRYGQHLKRDELKAMLRPSTDATTSVVSWLKSSGVATYDIEDDGEWINLHTTIAQAESMLSTKFHVYGNSINNSTQIRTLQYSVPRNVATYITMIQPTTRFGQIMPQHRKPFKVYGKGPAGNKQEVSDIPDGPLNVTACNATITPQCLRALYNVNDYAANPSNNSLFGVCGYLKEYAKYDDLATFTAKYAPYASNETFKYVLVNGGLSTQNDTVDDDGEANLDIQYAVSMSYKTPINYYSTGGLGGLVPDLDEPSVSQNEPYLDFLNYIMKVPDDKLPQTITTSYGEDEQSVPEAYSRTVCNMFGQLGARGVSVVFSSGDTGVGSACQTNDGKNTTRFLPIFPAACPYVTSVGATHYVEPESAISFSSGGFSDRFSRPAYQNAAVERYLSILGDQWKGLYNPNGRGFPDVAAQGSRFHVIDKDMGLVQNDDLFSGTSASAPTFAAIVSLLNNARLSSHLPPLGFLNPWIYAIGYQGLTDIVNGGSRGCTGIDVYSGLPAPYVPYASWNATKGWDPVSGYGTPNFKKLLELSTPGYAWKHM